MTTITQTLATSVQLSKAEALDVLSTALSAPWVTDDPSEVTLALPEGVVLSIEVAHYGEELPLTLDCHHDDAQVLQRVVSDVVASLESRLGWTVTVDSLRGQTVGPAEQERGFPNARKVQHQHHHPG
jgi:hypothetical protein